MNDRHHIVRFTVMTTIAALLCACKAVAQDATGTDAACCPFMTLAGRPWVASLIVVIILFGGLSVALAISVSQRRTAQQNGRETSRRLQTALQAARGTVFFTIDMSGDKPTLIDCSSGAEEALGYHRDEIIGKPISGLFTAADVPRIEALHRQVTETGQPCSTEPALVRQDGTLFPALITAYPVRDKDGNMPAVVDFFVDMTEHKKTEQQERQFLNHVQHAEKLKSLEIMAGGIAHDFNNLLVGVLGNADLALIDLSPLSPARASVEAIKEAAIEASELTRQMLAYAGKGRLHIELVDVNTLIQSIAQLLRISVDPHAVLQYHLTEDIAPIEADVAQIRQLLLSLVTNASDALGDKSGVVDVRSSMKTVSCEYLASTYLDENLPGGDYVCLEISDTGIGMPPEQCARIFDPFFTTKSSGKGLGLATVLGIVRRHNGAVRVESYPGKGTTFTILLPASEKPLTATPLNGTFTAVDAPQTLGGTVLVIDDQERVRNVLEGMLMRRECTVYTAEDGRAGIALFAKYHPDIDLVILNMTMPGLSGSETLQELVKVKPNIKVILCTGYAEEEARQKFAGAQLAGFIQKPFKMDDMVALVARVLNA